MSKAGDAITKKYLEGAGLPTSSGPSAAERTVTKATQKVQKGNEITNKYLSAAGLPKIETQGSLYSQIAQQMKEENRYANASLYSQYMRNNLRSGGPSRTPAPTYTQQGSLYAPAARQPAMPGLTGAQRQMIAERNNANGPLAASANPNDWSGDAAMYLQAGGDIDRATVRGLDYSQRRFIGDMAGGVRNAVNEAGYLYQSGRESMKDPTKGPNIEEQLLYDFATDPHAMDAYNAWRASLKPGEYETMEMMGQLPSPGQLYVQQRMREMGEEFQANYEEPELKRITNLGENFQQETEQLYGDMTGGWKTAADLAGSIGQQVPAMALRVIPVVGPALSNAYFFGSAAGASTEEAYADGASLQQAVDYGALSGAVEMLTEHVFDGMSGLLGKGAADDAVEGLIHALTRRNGNNALRNGLRWTFGALGEAGEEGISALVDPLLRTVYNNKTVRESYKDLDWEDVWNQVLLGGLSGGVLSSIGLANGQFKGKNAELDARVANEVVNDFLTNTPEGQALAQQAENNLATQNAPRTNQGAENGQTGPYASIETLPDGRQYVKADREVIYGNDPDSWGEQITEYINGKIRNGEDVPVTTVDGDTLLLTADTAGKAAFRNYVYEQEGRQRGRPMTDEEYNAKINAEAHIDELAEASKMRDRAEPPVPDRGGLHDFAKDGWKYRTVFFRDFDGKYYKITLSTGLNNGAYTVYNVGVMEETPFPNLSGYGTSNGRAGNGASADTVSQTAGNGNTNLQTEGTNNGEQSGHGASENGNDGVRAGEQGTGISELGEEGTLPGGEGQVRESVPEGRGENLRSVTLRELGVTNAAEGATIQVQDEQSLTGDAARAAQQVWQQGLEPVAFRGEMIVNGASVNGYIENGRVFFRTDAKYRDGTPISSEAIVRHESVHNAKDSDPGIIDIGMEIVRQSRSETEVQAMKDAYRETYKDLYDFEKMSEEDITNMLVEEIVADAYAGLNYFRDGGETVEQVRSAIGNQVESQAAESAQETRGPPRALTEEVTDGYEILHGPGGDVRVVRLSDGKEADPRGNIRNLAESIPYLEKLEVVTHVDGSEIARGKNSASENILDFFDSIGNKVEREGFGAVALDNYGARGTAAKQHHPTKAKIAAVAAVPAVIQYGRQIHSQQHGAHMSYTFAAPVDFMGKKIYVAAVVHDMNDAGITGSKYYLDEILDTDGFRFNITEDTSSPKSDPLTQGEDSGSPDASSMDSIPQSNEKSNTQNNPRASAEVTDRRADEQARREQQQAQYSMARELAEGRGIDIMPGEGEEAISSANGLTDADNADLEGRNTSTSSAPDGAPSPRGEGIGDGFDASILYGMPSAEERAEARATEKAAKEGNEALARFAEEMPDDPMDLYQEQNPVNARKGGDGSNIPGREKISAEKAKEKQTVGQKISDAWHSLIRSMANEGDAIHQAGRRTGNRALDGMYFYAKAATQRAQQWIQGQRMNFDLSESGKGLNAIFDPIRAKGEDYYENFQLYLYHMLNVERMSRSTEDAVKVAQETVNQLSEANPRISAMTDEQLRNKARQYQEGGGLGYEDDNRGELIYQYWQAKQELERAEKAQNKPVFGWEVDADRSRQAAADLLAAHPEFEDLAQEVYDYVDALLQYRVDAGLITKEDMAKLKATYPHYVPVMYTMAEDAARIRDGNMQVSSTVKSAKGGDSQMEPLHLALARQTLAVMKNAGYQQLGAEVMKEYRDNQETMSRYVTNMEESESVWDESMADNDDVNVPYKNVISVFQNGKRYDLTLSDDMSFAFQSLQPGKKDAAAWRHMQRANDLFKKLCTAYNPLFMITNPVRDVQDALFYSTDTKRWLRNYPRAIAQIKGSGKYWQMYQAMGGVQNSYFDWATGENVKESGGKMGKLKRKIEALNLAVEQWPRLAEFMTVLQNAERKNGQIAQADLMEAFNAAAEITTNFGRSGTIGKWINRNLVPFWNPGVQGLSKAVRTATETRGFKAWGNLAIKAAALGMLPALLNGLLYRDDDEWDTIDDQLKMEYYLFKTSDGVWIKVPKGRVLAALSMPVVGAQESMRGDEVDWKELTMQAFGSVAPNNPLETNLLSTAVQAKLFDADDPGKTWYGGDIESRRLQGYAPGERYDESTDVLSKWLGKQLNISPKKINYVIDQYSGILGDLVLPYLTPKAERGAYIGDVAVPLSNAFMSRFTLDTVTNNTISGEYYGLLDELGFAAKGGDNPSAIAERYMNRAGSTVSDIYAQIREIENDTELTDKEKTALTRDLRKQLNEFEKQVVADAQEYLTSAREYIDAHPEFDYTDDAAVDGFVEGYNRLQTNEKYMIDADQAAGKMKDEVYREVNREHFGAEYALQVYNKDVYEKARSVHDESGLSYDDYYDYYFGTQYLYADKDEEGNSIAGTKTDKVVSFLEGMDITDEQRNALYHAENHTWNYPAGITEYLKDHPEYDFMDDDAVVEYAAEYNRQQSDEKYYIDAAGAISKMRREAYREIYRDEYGAEYALKFFDKDVHEEAQELNTSAGLSFDDYYDFYFGTRYMYADKDENGNSISGSKKEKVVGFINDMDVSDAEKDALYLAAGYKENTLKTTPWNGGSGRYSSGGGSGGQGGRSSRTKAPKTKAVKGSGKIQLPKVSSSVSRTGAGKSGTGGMGGKADASLSLIEIIDKYYGGNALAAAMDGGARARGRTTVDFEL